MTSTPVRTVTLSPSIVNYEKLIFSLVITCTLFSKQNTLYVIHGASTNSVHVTRLKIQVLGYSSNFDGGVGFQSKFNPMKCQTVCCVHISKLNLRKEVKNYKCFVQCSSHCGSEISSFTRKGLHGEVVPNQSLGSCW